MQFSRFLIAIATVSLLSSCQDDEKTVPIDASDIAQIDQESIETARHSIGPEGKLVQAINRFKNDTGTYPEELGWLVRDLTKTPEFIGRGHTL